MIPIPPDESRRLDVLRSYDILDTPPEGAFDDIARLAAHVCRTPIALVTLIDEKREWFKASVGIDLQEATREGFCAHTILGRDLLVVQDALKDERFAENPYVIGPPGVRFYAGAPLLTPEGPVIGTLCVIDTVARPLDPAEGQALVRLASTVQTQLELRRALNAAHKSAEESMSHEEALLDLARSCFEARDVDEMLRCIVRKVAETLRVARVNFWRIAPECIRCVTHYQSSTGTYSSGMTFDLAGHPRYFEALRKETVVAADDARKDPRTSEFTESYLVPLGITSMMDAPVFIGGVLEGLLCHEHVGPARQWSREEQVFAVGVANLISLVIEQSQRRKVEQALASSEERRLRAEETARGRDSFERLVGKSAPMQEVYRKLRLAAQSDVTVLLTGESGTGKELAASAIHSLSERRDKPFVAVNCSAIPETLLESELFGHVKGAFTGAIRDKVGLFQAAGGGTLFLDEIGDMAPSLQVKVLRALQEREVRRVGDERVIKIDVRIVAATNRDLAALVASGKVREDFYYRIKVFDIVMPPLRDRRDDIPLLVEHSIARLAKERGRAVPNVAPPAMRALMSYDWPGNVRELVNAVEHAFVSVNGGAITPGDLPAPVRGPEEEGPVEAGEEVKKRIIDALTQAGGSRAKAAKLLGISRVTLWKWMTKFGIVNEDA
jgi:two-component system, NtrC family, response regulator HydG